MDIIKIMQTVSNVYYHVSNVLLKQNANKVVLVDISYLVQVVQFVLNIV